MKKLLLMSLITLASFALFAQKREGVSYGVKAGIAFPHIPSSIGSHDAITSFYVGGTVSVPVRSYKSSFLSVQPGLTLINKGVLEKNPNREFSTSYLEIPVNLMAHFDGGGGSKFFVGAGPYVAIALASKEPKDAPIKSYIKPLDFGFNFLLGYQIKNGFSINGSYGFGLTPMGYYNVPDKNSVLSVGLGYSF